MILLSREPGLFPAPYSQHVDDEQRAPGEPIAGIFRERRLGHRGHEEPVEAGSAESQDCDLANRYFNRERPAAGATRSSTFMKGLPPVVALMTAPERFGSGRIRPKASTDWSGLPVCGSRA